MIFVIGAELTGAHLALIVDVSDITKEIQKIEHTVYDKSFDKHCTVCDRNNHTTDKSDKILMPKKCIILWMWKKGSHK